MFYLYNFLTALYVVIGIGRSGEGIKCNLVFNKKNSQQSAHLTHGLELLGTLQKGSRVIILN